MQSVQQLVNSQGRRLSQDLKPAPIEYISNNGSMGQPQLAVLDTVEGGPPSASFISKREFSQQTTILNPSRVLECTPLQRFTFKKIRLLGA